MAERSVGQ
jgi:hypothetical protein